ncbi:MAG: Asp/Glu racemase [Candidatus Parabeggiatoa sp. nov. 1]|nr:MAG: Asp/Glu racemase [Gammaproteobacteria bacterium]
MARNRGRIGIIVPSSNTNLEPDCALLTPPGITLHFTRVGGYDVDGIPDGEEMRHFASQSLSAALDLLTPADVDFIAYGCTSATLASGPEFDQRFQAEITAKTGLPAVTAAGALVEALSTLEVSRIAFTSPYVAQLNLESIAFLSECGIEVVNHVGVGRDISSREQGLLTPDDAYELGRRADHSQAEALVISCTDFRALEALTALERDLDKPVVTSNQALMYASCVRLGLDTSAIKAGGRLFVEHSPKARD